MSSNVYDEIEDALHSGTLVLYFGTSCQVSAIKKYVAVKNIVADSLYTCDILCHGVGSPGIWRNFIKWIDPKSKVKYLTFKDKSRGWEHPRCIANTENRELSLRGYSWLYFSDSIMRPVCYECKFADVNREGDFTIGDFWKAKIKAPEIYNSRGTSFIMVNTDQGSNLFETVKNHLIYKEVGLDDIMQNNLRQPTRKSKHRPTVMEDFAKMSPGLFFRKWEIILLAGKIKNKLIR